MAKLLIRLAYTLAYRIIRGWEALIGRSVKGAGVAVCWENKLLVVRHSYRPGWSLPGGHIKANEDPKKGAIRELHEEVGIYADPKNLRKVFQPRRDKYLFEIRFSSQPPIEIDNYEIIDARFVEPAKISNADSVLLPYLRELLGEEFLRS